MNIKIKRLEELGEILDNHRKEGKKIVHCHGVFDIIHYGHVKHFLSAKKQGDILVVTLTPDRFIQKGPGRPFFNEEIRLEHLALFEFIDYVAINNWSTAVETIKIIRPEIYAKGKEVLDNKNIDRLNNLKKPKSNLEIEKETVESFGGKLYLTDEITFSSSKIINQITSSISEDAKKFLSYFKTEYKPDKIIEALDSLKELKVLVIGDAIFDEYVYCRDLGKSAKDIMIPHKFISSEKYCGPPFIVANHLAGLVNDLSVVTCIGEGDYDFVEENLKENIERNIFVQKNSKTLTKKRYINKYKGNKVFAIYNAEEFKISLETENKIINYLEKNLEKFDLVVISDFGHGFMTEKIINFLSNSNKFLAINCQLNAGNFGFNFITKYRSANFVSLNDGELRLPFQEKKSNIEVPIRKLSNALNLDKINVTLGKKGSSFYQGGKLFEVPSFIKNTVDTIGAGDAVFAITSLLAYKDVDPIMIPFIGNSVGALAVQIVGNKSPVDPQELKKFISYLMK